MQVRKILGGIVNDRLNHCIAKLENGRFAVGPLAVGQKVRLDAQYSSLNEAYDYWFATLPAHSENQRGI